MEVATSTNLFSKGRDGRLHTPYLESIRRCRQAGFRSLDFSFVEFFFTKTELSGPDWETELEKIQKESQSLGVSFHQAHLPYNPGYMPVWKGEEKEEYFRLAARSVEISKRLGVRWLVAHPFTQCEAAEYDDAASVRFNHEFYDPIVDHAFSLGVGIAYENMIEYPQRRKFSARAEELTLLVDSYHDSRVGACWDFGHGNRLYENEAFAIETLGKRIVALHVNDNGSISDLHHLPYLGTVHWEDALQALKNTGYQGDFTYEVYGLTKNMPETLKDLAARYAYDVGKYCVDYYQSLESERSLFQ